MQTSANSPDSERRNAARFGHFAHALADEVFDIEVRRMWNEHLLTMPIEVAVTKHWRSGFWKNWYTALNFYDFSEVGNGSDIFCV